MVEDQVDEFDLVRAERLAGKEAGECLLGGFTIHADQRAHKEPEPLALRLGQFDRIRPADAAFGKHSLQLGQVGRRQGLVHPQFADRDVVLVRAQEGLRLGTEPGVVRTLAEPRQGDRRFLAHRIREVGVDGLALLFVDELDQIAQAPAHAFEHRHGHVLPPRLRLHVLDERQPIAHHRNRGLLLEQAGKILHLLAQANEAGLATQHGKLQLEHQQVEALGLFTLRVQRRRQSRHFARQLGKRLR